VIEASVSKGYALRHQKKKWGSNWLASDHWLVDISGGDSRKAMRHKVMNFVLHECKFFATEDQSEFLTAAAAAANTSASTLTSKLLAVK
jgi:hypothetical protein